MSELPELVTALLDPKAYPNPPQKVSLMQTQMSYVFLADDYVYKTKKPVNFGFLDYSTLDKRLFYCKKEVELNRRLCPDAYLGVVPITSQQGNIVMEGQGEAIEYAVKMRYLPQEAMMNVLLPENKVTPEMLTAVAVKLAEFHRKAETITKFGGLDTVIQNTEENFSQTEPYTGNTLTPETFNNIRDYTHRFLDENADLFHKRVANGMVKDCHGDLHAAHVCFHNGISIYDCIEFNDRFRQCDIASEIAFLAMDLDHYGRADLSRQFVDAYVTQSQDKELLQFLDFYKCYRAYVRGKVEGFKLFDPYISTEEKARVATIAKDYFLLAESYTKSD